ncbi:hypothetical protein HPB47_017221, partial [Ixodes persulcatus]
MALEATLRFSAMVSEMELKLRETRALLDKESFHDIDQDLRPSRAEFSLISE